MLDNKWIRALLAFAVVLSLIILLGMSVLEKIEENTIAKRERLIQNELITSGLIAERVELESQLAKLSESERRIGTATFLFTEPNEVIYDELYAAMTLWKIQGTIAISDTSLPGDEGNMSVAEYKAMLDSGWSAAVIFDGDGSLADYLDALVARLAPLGIQLPNTLYFRGFVGEEGYFGLTVEADGSYKIGAELSRIMEDYYIKFIVQETYQTKPVCHEDFDKPFVYCEAVGFNAYLGTENNKKLLSQQSLIKCAETGGAVVYTIGFDPESTTGDFYGVTDTDDTTDDFNRMLTRIAGDYKSALHIMNLNEVKEQRNRPVDTEILEEKARLQAELDEVLAKIQAVRDKYSK
ncbi:MAG: hypothetical protein IIX96_02185 [Clostridia bacterium]|nr:hypothetical protein [Clostridia bacterium]